MSSTSRPSILAPGRGPVSPKLLACKEGELADMVFHIDPRGRRHWLPSEGHLLSNGFSWEDLQWVEESALRQYRPGGNVPLRWSHADWLKPHRTSAAVLREIATSQLRGVGVEFGAGTHPVAVPLHCEVRFADFVPEAELRNRAYGAQTGDFVDLSYVTSIEKMEGIDDGSLDFLIACHVIEHTRNPLLALKTAHAKLKEGGKFVLIVPDKLLTFDKDRELTGLEHILLDYERPSRDRDTLHYVEFFSHVLTPPAESFYQRVVDAIATDYDIHFHTWTYESFGQMVRYASREISPWGEVWSQPAVTTDATANEFYFVLTK